MQRIVSHNMSEKSKTDENDLFYGKLGSNNLHKPKGVIADY